MDPVIVNMEKNTPLISLSWENINVNTPGKKSKNLLFFKTKGVESKHIVKNGK